MVNIDQLPCDVWVYVLKYGIVEEALKVYDISENFQRACCEIIKNRMVKMLYEVADGIPTLQYKLRQSPMADDGLRYSIMHTIIFLRYLLTEINLLFSMVWRYSTNENAWILLCPYLFPVIEEFSNLLHSCLKLELRRRKLRLLTHNVRRLLYKYHDFTTKFENNLEAMLADFTGCADIEVKALDTLLSCPSINFQLCLSHEIGNKCLYNISSFFGFYNLNPSFQVPDLYKKNLSVLDKKLAIIKFLRECVQYENISFLQSITNDIADLELCLEVADNINYQLIQNLCDKYQNIQGTPYSPIFRSSDIIQHDKGRTFNEHYHKCVTYNQDMTGMVILINIPNQPSENLPFILHSFRGKRKPLLDERILQPEGKEWCFLDCHSKLDKPIRHSIKLCMNYWQGFSPSETIIDVIYDQNNECCISSNSTKYNLDVIYDSDEEHCV